MSNKIPGIVKTAAITLLLAACGNASEAPPGSEIQISPPDFITDVTAGACSGVDAAATVEAREVTITVFGPSGNPLGDIDLHIQMDWSGSTFSGLDVVRLYDDEGAGNNNGTWDDTPEEIVSAIDDSVSYDTKTNANGSRTFILRKEIGSCTFAGAMYVTSGSTNGIMEFENTGS